MPPRYFSWRIRGNSFYFAESIIAEINALPLDDSESENASKAPFDVIVATSMVDLATLIGICPVIAGIPSLLYFHENQFAYPETGHVYSSLEPKMVTIFSALAATRLCFNSDYNKRSFIDGVTSLMKKFPDFKPNGIEKRLDAKSSVLPVPHVHDLASSTIHANEQDRPIRVVWNHRWEYDKGPDRLLALIGALPESLNIVFHVLGQRFAKSPVVMDDIKALLGNRNWLGEWGFVESRSRYWNILSESDIVLSTAIHDFQGLAIQEAVQLGCVPLVPNRLAYADIYDESFRYSSLAPDMDASTAQITAEAQAGALYVEQFCYDLPVPPNLDFLLWSNMREHYADCFVRLSGGLQV